MVSPLFIAFTKGKGRKKQREVSMRNTSFKIPLADERDEPCVCLSVLLYLSALLLRSFRFLVIDVAADVVVPVVYCIGRIHEVRER